jgi:uncharacterized SAM-binding protein YcdF (DUF218 family)
MELTPFLFGLYKFVKYAAFPLTWIVFLTGFTTILVFLPISRKRTLYIRVFAVSSFLLLTVASNPSVSYSLLGLLEANFPTIPTTGGQLHDAIVVLSGGVRAQGTLRPTVELMDQSLHRTICSVDLYMRKLAPTLVLSGGRSAGFGSAPVESLEMKHWAIRLGVPQSFILTEETSRNTYESAVGTKRILGNASILLVTNAFHMRRAMALFEKQGLRVTPVPCGYLAGNRPEDNWSEIGVTELLPDIQSLERTTIAVTETVGFVLYWLLGEL